MANCEVEAAIYNLSGQLLLGKASEEEIKEVIKLASQHGLLPLLRQEFCSVGRSLCSEN